MCFFSYVGIHWKKAHTSKSSPKNHPKKTPQVCRVDTPPPLQGLRSDRVLQWRAADVPRKFVLGGDADEKNGRDPGWFLRVCFGDEILASYIYRGLFHKPI